MIDLSPEHIAARAASAIERHAQQDPPQYSPELLAAAVADVEAFTLWLNVLLSRLAHFRIRTRTAEASRRVFDPGLRNEPVAMVPSRGPERALTIEPRSAVSLHTLAVAGNIAGFADSAAIAVDQALRLIFMTAELDDTHLAGALQQTRELTQLLRERNEGLQKLLAGDCEQDSHQPDSPQPGANPSYG